MKPQKLFLILSFILFSTNNIFAQNEMKARIEYEDAEMAFQNKDFKSALSHLEKAETALGKWTAKISYLKIMATDKVIEYEEWNEELKKLKQEVTAYMKYANTNPENIDMERVREIYTVEEKVNEVWEWKKYLDDEKKWVNESDYSEGVKAYKNNDFEKALALFHKSAEKGNPAAMNYIGIIYLNGNGVQKNIDEALKWYEKGSKAGMLYSSRNIANTFFNGKEVQKDYKRALEYYHKAAAKGDTHSMIRIAYLNKEGFGTEKNLDEAMKWYKKAADRGDKIGLTGIGLVYALKGEDSKAFSYLKEAAEKEETEAMIFLGLFYEKGVGVSKNIDEAVRWLVRASEDYPRVNTLLARIYYDYHNYDKAANRFTIAIENNVTNIEKADYYKIGVSMFETKSYTKALEWLEKSYNAGVEKSKSASYIAHIYDSGLGIEKDKKKVKEWRSK